MTFVIDADEHALMHYGIARKSGRYPWGSGETASERSRDFLGTIAKLKSEGMSDADIMKGFGMNTTDFRTAKSMAKNAKKAADIAHAQSLSDHGYSNVEIGKKMGINESSVRSLLAPGQKDKADILETTSNMLRDEVAAKKYIDVGSGVEAHLGISKEKLGTALSVLKQEGYEVHTIQVDQAGTNNKTLVKVLAPPGTTYRDIVGEKESIGQISRIDRYSEDGGRSFLGLEPPRSVDASRIKVRYAEEGGTDADGVIHIRPGVDDISLGNARYAQVRIMVNGTHYLKGMAMYKDDLPDGVDMVFNTNKSNKGDPLKAMKPLKEDKDGNVDMDNPFGSVVRQKKTPGGELSALNIVNEEGAWETWSKNMSSQMLSKQSPKLAKGQLDVTFENKKADLDEIMALTNPAVKKKLLESYADAADSSAVHLKAAALPRTASHVILPINSLKDNEIYAPNYRNGERVALVRYPHGGIFEIPELVVNNNHPPAKRALGQARDAVAINSKVAERLSGADFDGDTVLVIPNNRGEVKTAPALAGLKGFDPQRQYPAYEGMPKMSAQTKGHQMGLVSNLITDMTIKGATQQELARAVRHSMVVIDAEKHNLNYKQSSIDNGIPQLMKKYQDRSGGGSSTLISRATAREDVLERKPRSAAKGGPVDPVTGKRVYEETGASWVDAKGTTRFKTQRSVKLAETDNAHTLSSGTPIEKVYADHSNRMKDLANTARREALKVQATPYSPSAKAAYAPEVASLNAKLNIAIRNRPLERQAQLLANTVYQQKRDANPDMDKAEEKKLKGQALMEARRRTGAGKERIEFTPQEWQAVQAGAISRHKLDQILDNADLDQVKSLATPRTTVSMTPAKQSRAKAMADSGYTQAEIADALGVSVSTLKAELNGGS